MCAFVCLRACVFSSKLTRQQAIWLYKKQKRSASADDLFLVRDILVRREHIESSASGLLNMSFSAHSLAPRTCRPRRTTGHRTTPPKKGYVGFYKHCICFFVCVYKCLYVYICFCLLYVGFYKLLYVFICFKLGILKGMYTV